MRAEVNANKVEGTVTGTSLDGRELLHGAFKSPTINVHEIGHNTQELRVNTIILYNPNLPSHKSNQTSQGDTFCHMEMPR